nr:ribonuclease H-like domain-containing protein [Tanacetum cinerariifolium]
MKMEHYLCHTDYPIWQVIPNGNGPVSVTTYTNGMIKVLPPKTAEEIVARERERKARTTLLMALPEDHLAKFYKMGDAKEMWEANKSRFSGNDESKKMQKYFLKQQFEGFSMSSSEGLHEGYGRFQTLLSQLEIHGVGVSHEDANQKFLRSLPSSWSQVALIMRTKPGLDTLSFDDLYNNLRVFERDVKGTTTSSSSNTHNVAFVSADNTSSTNDVSNAYSVSSPSVFKLQNEGSASYTDEVIHSFFANQSSAPQLDCDDLEQINDDDLEEMDLKWQVAMISMRIKKFHKRTGRKLQFDTKDTFGFDKTKVECFNCYKMGHFARDCRAKWNQDSRRRDGGYNGNKARDNSRRPAHQDDSKALVTMDGEAINWSGHVEQDTQNFAMMAYSSSNSSSDNEVQSCSKTCAESYARFKKLYDEQREKLGDDSVEITAYTLALKKVEAQLLCHQQNQLAYEQKIKFMKINLDDKTDVLTYHKKLLAEALKEKEDLKTKAKNCQNSSKNLTRLLNTQMSANDKFGLGYGDYRYGSILSYENEVLQSVFMNKECDLENTPVNDRYVEGMHAVSPLMTGNYMPSRPDVEIDYSKFTYGPKQNSVDELDSKPVELLLVILTLVLKQLPLCLHQENVKEIGTPNHHPKIEKQDRHSHTRKGLGYAVTRKSCFTCGSFSHLIRDCDFHEKRMAKQAALTKIKEKVTGQKEHRPIWNNVQRINHQNKIVPTALLTKTGKLPVNAARQNLSRQATLTSSASKVNTARPFVNETRPTRCFYKTHSPNKRLFDNKTTQRTTFSYHKVNTVNTSLSVVKGNGDTAVKASKNVVIGEIKEILGTKSSNITYMCSSDILDQHLMIKYFYFLHGCPLERATLCWNTLTYGAKTSAYNFQLNETRFVLDANLLRDALEITPINQAHQFGSPPSGDAIMNFVNQLGYTEVVHFVSRMAMDNLYQPWRVILSMINQCLTGKTFGHARPRYPALQMLWGIIMSTNVDYAELLWEEFVQAIQTFLTDEANLGSLTKKGKKDKPHVILFYLRLGNLKFVPKGEVDEVFGMPIPNKLISNNIRNVPYYNAYLEMVTKHDRKISAEKERTKKTASAKQPMPMPAIEKSTKPAPAPKPKSTKERLSKASTAKPPKPKHAKENQAHVGGVAIQEPVAEAMQPLPVVEGKGKAIVTKEQPAHSPLALHTPKRRSTMDQFIFQRRTPAIEAYSTGPSAQAQDDTYVNIICNSPSLADAKIGAASEKTNNGSDTEILQIDEEQGKDVDEQVNLEEKTDELDQGQARSDPDPGESRRALAGPDPKPTHDEFMNDLYPKVQESLKFRADEHVILEDPISSTGTLSSMKNLEDAYVVGDQFINDKSTKDEPEKPNVEAKVVSMVTVSIYQASSSVPPLSTPKNKTLDNTSQNLGSRVFNLELIDLPHKIDEAVRESMGEYVHVALQAPLRDRFRELQEADMKEILHQRMFETGTYKSLSEHVALYEALEVSIERANWDELLTEMDKSRKRRCDDQDPPPPLPDLDLSKRRRHDTGGSGSSQPQAPQSSAWKKSDTRDAPPSSSKQQSNPHAEQPVEDIPMPDTANISDSEDTNYAHLLKIKKRPEWLKPIPDDEKPATPEPAWVIPSSYILIAENNWANALATTYQPLAENSLLENIGDMRTFMHCGQALSISKIKAARYLNFVVFHVGNNERKIMRFNEIYKFSDGTLTNIMEALDYRVKKYKVNRLNPGMNTRFWTDKDVSRSKEFIHDIERRLKTRRIFQNLECFVGG